MRKYENGTETKKQILQASKKLFLEKGFWETSYDEICSELYLNRSTVHYHFGSKENLRYEVQWSIVAGYRSLAARYFGDSRIQALAVVYLHWCHMIADPGIRRFELQFARDYPTFDPSKTLPFFFLTLYRYIFEDDWPIDDVEDLSLCAAYGNMVALMLLVGDRPGDFSGRELFLHGMKIWLHCCDMPQELQQKVQTLVYEITQTIPEDAVLGICL